jgi:formamidopyrimidine-DNA glycosylase
VPELPDVLLYLSALRGRVVGREVAAVRLASPFLLRSTSPPLEAIEGRQVVSLGRLGKRIVFEFTDELFIVIHLMIAGRFRWRPPRAPLPPRLGQWALDFEHGTLMLTEAGTKRQASLHVVAGREGLRAHDPGGLDVRSADVATFSAAIRRENRTLKRVLTDPRILDGIGNAYSDEILHAARLSPFKQTRALEEAECARLFEACQRTLNEWIVRLAAESGDGFPEKVTAFRPQMAVHGRYRQPCPACGTPVQRVVYAANEANYCPSCQTEGRLLADRSLSRLLKDDWPRTLDELERRFSKPSRED